MKVDYIIVGLGLAGLTFAEVLEKNNKSFVVFENQSQNSSLVAAGVYNPVILKRFTQVWDADDQLAKALPFYKNIEKKLDIKVDYKFDILRVFKSIEEQNNWFSTCDKPFFESYMEPKVINNKNTNVIAPLGAGRITNIGKIDIKNLINAYKKYLIQKNSLEMENFEYSEINFINDVILYKNITTKRVVFCEGFGVKKNPFFKDILLREAKGELITIHAPELKITDMLKSAVFVLPLGNDLYKVGATFNWSDKTLKPTESGKEELVEKLKKVINCDYKIVEHTAGIRPTVKDRRPILGKHQQYEKLAILNGLGTRGVMLAPKMATILYEHLENKKPINKEISITRFC